MFQFGKLFATILKPFFQYSGHTLTTVTVPSEKGFQPEMDDQQRLEAIDSKLKFLLPPEEFDAMTYVSKDVNLLPLTKEKMH